MGPKQDSRDDSQLEQRHECDNEQRVVERCDHGEQGVGCEQGANYEGYEQMVSEPEPDCGAEREENGSGEDSENDRPPFSLAEVDLQTDGSVDFYFGPKAPTGKEANWIATVPGKGWFVYFRIYGPDARLRRKLEAGGFRVGEMSVFPLSLNDASDWPSTSRGPALSGIPLKGNKRAWRYAVGMFARS